MKLEVPVVGIIVVLTMLACQPQFLSKPADQATGPTGPMGTIKMNISPVSAPLAKALGVVSQSTGSSSKTFLIITKVHFDLLLDGEIYAEKTVPVSYAPGPSPEPISWPMVPAADGYQVEAWTYNENSSEDPILHGISETFSVVSGTETPVVVRPIPIAPIAVPTDHSSVQTSLDSCWPTSEPGEYGWGEERWFAIDATGHSAIRVNADASANSAVIFLIADQEGSTRAMALSGAMNGGPVYWNYGGIASAGILTPYSTYYVGLLTLSNVVDTSVLSTVDVNFEPFNDDIYEENDLISTASLVDKTVVHDCIDLDPADWSYPRNGGDWYKFNLAPTDASNVSVAIVFDHDESNLDLELWQWPEGENPAQIAVSNSSTFSGPGEPVLEMELIEATLVPGTTYYICVHSYNWPNGADYQLQWVAGTGTITIGIE